MLCFALSAVTASATVELTEISAYYPPGFAQPIQQVKFADLNGYGQPEILAADGDRVALYCPDGNNILFESDLDPRHMDYCICLADIDYDLLPDILIGYYFDVGAFESDTICKLELYYGHSDYITRDSFFYTSGPSGPAPRSSPSSFVDLQAIDFTGDGSAELFFSYDRYGTFELSQTTIQYTTGQTCLYDRFPDPPNWGRDVLLKGIWGIDIPSDAEVHVTNRYYDFMHGSGNVKSSGWIEFLSSGGDSLSSIGEPFPSACQGDSTLLLSAFECLAVGNINENSEGTEILARQRYSHVCYNSDAISFDSSGIDLRLYSVRAVDDIVLLWRDPFPAVTSNFHYSPDFAGSFLSASGGRIIQHSGLNGEQLQSSAILDVDTIIWCDDPTLTGSDFITIKNQTVRIYRLGITTHAGDSQSETNLPESFRLGNPYPNPFNPSCVIEYSLPWRAHTTISVFNILGQKVATIVDESKPAGNHKIEWNSADQSGQPVASGIYLYRMQAGDFTDSKKMLLLK